LIVKGEKAGLAEGMRVIPLTSILSHKGRGSY
jgi:hypothetical protein